MYEYAGTVVRWSDGDSVILDLDLGFRFKWERTHFRIAGIDTPETNSPDEVLRGRALVAKARVNELLPVGSECLIRSARPVVADKYGRWLCHIFRSHNRVPLSLVSINEVLLKEGLAKAYDGGAR